MLGQIELARTDVLIGIEPDLLEADDAGDDVDFAVRTEGLGTIDRRSVRVSGGGDISAMGIVSQYDVVCICCSGRSSSPEPTFSFV